MTTVGLWVKLEAKPGKEEDVEAFLESGQALVDEEPETTAWFAVKLGPPRTESSTFSPTSLGARPTSTARSPRR